MSTIPDIDAYIRNEPPHIRKVLKTMRALVKKAAPKASEKIAWDMPTFYLEGNLLHFAAFKSHMSIFPGSDAVARFKNELGPRLSSKSKGTIQIPYDVAIPVGLVTKIVRFCVKRNLAAAKAKAAKSSARRKKARGA
jgi:uncharacterized protein YdhG (YjbR/CyaY superfamily)